MCAPSEEVESGWLVVESAAEDSIRRDEVAAESAAEDGVQEADD